MRISELAQRSGIPATTLRYYEKEGLLPAPRAGNGYRAYGPDAVDRLAFIAQARHLDLPLAAVRELVTAWESEPCHSVRDAYRSLLVERSVQVGERVVALVALQETLAQAITRLDDLPERDAPCDDTCVHLDSDGPTAASGPDRAPVASAVGASAPVADAPVACTLGAGDYAARTAAWRDLLAGAVREEVAGGVRATLPVADLERTTALAAQEQECCAFYSFRLDLRGPVFDLTITAPPDAGPLLADLLPARTS
ncbi:MerR family transcriptional regulator [Antribacter gilvus]|uniref:MerR family transcriptional regulator n=1 Tax=Antribacter gilvus TaxID=2304675 RepID=UPI000F78E3C6|nr:MerR family transcriptional regulator [Antribacter gilvus]